MRLAFAFGSWNLFILTVTDIFASGFPLSLNFTGFELYSWIYRSQKVYIIIRITTEHSFYGLVGLNAALNLFSDHINMILQSNKYFYVPFFMLNSFRLPLCFGFRGDFPFCKTFSIKFSPSNLNFKAELFLCFNFFKPSTSDSWCDCCNRAERKKREVVRINN